MSRSNNVIVALVLLSLSCANRTADDDEDPPPEPPEVTTCRDWCEVAVDCSETYKQLWDFATQSECEDRCIEYYEGTSYIFEGKCDEHVITLFQCTSMVATCEEFLNFEKLAFVLGGLTDVAPCVPELHETLDAGCT